MSAHLFPNTRHAAPGPADRPRGDIVNDDDQRADRAVRICAQVGRQSTGVPVSVTHVCAAAVTAVGVDGAGSSVMAGPTVRDTVHATDRVAGELEEWQLIFGQGPCLDAFTDGGPVLAMDLHSAESLTRSPCSARPH